MAPGPKKAIPNKPGVENWVSAAGGLPPYIRRVAEHLHGEGYSVSRSISSAVNTIKRWAAGTTNNGGKVTPETRAKAQRALAQWEKMKARSGAGKKRREVKEAIERLQNGDQSVASKGALLALAEKRVRRKVYAHGLLDALDSDRPNGAVVSARLLREGRSALAIGGPDPTPEQIEEARAILQEEVDFTTVIVEVSGYGAQDLDEAPVDTAAVPDGKNGAAPKGGVKPKGAGKPKVRDKNRRAGKAAADAEFEKKHPRAAAGRLGAGSWIKKGEGMGGEPAPDVKQLQNRLAQLGYATGAPDGRFGDLTDQAVKRFQKDYGLETTGEVDAATIEVLRNPVRPKKEDGAGGGPTATGGAEAGTGKYDGEDPKDSKGREVADRAEAKSESRKADAEAKRDSRKAEGGRGSSSDEKGERGGGGTPRDLDPSDQRSIRAFQKAHGLKVDGVVGPETQGALKALRTGGSKASDGKDSKSKGEAEKGSSAKGSSDSKGDRDDEGDGDTMKLGTGMGDEPDKAVKVMQRFLVNSGIGVGEAGVDGRFGPDTQRAVKRLQKKYGLEADGVVGPKTQRLLDRLSKRAKKVEDKQEPKAPASKKVEETAMADDTLTEGKMPPQFAANAAKKKKGADKESSGKPWEKGKPGAGTPKGEGKGKCSGCGHKIAMHDKDGKCDECAKKVKEAAEQAAERIDAALVSLREQLTEARAERAEAADSATFVRARAREVALAERLASLEPEAATAIQEARSAAQIGQPRDRIGQWVDVLAKLQGKADMGSGTMHHKALGRSDFKPGRSAGAHGSAGQDAGALDRASKLAKGGGSSQRDLVARSLMARPGRLREAISTEEPGVDPWSPEQMMNKSISDLAHAALTDWGTGATMQARVHLGYMRGLGAANPDHVLRTARIVRAFLSSASEWSGPVATAVKRELAARLKASGA